jgi:hypothetical protein
LRENSGVNLWRKRLMKECFRRREFFRGIGVGTIGLGFGVSIFNGLYQYAEAATEEEEHALLMKGTVDFKGSITSTGTMIGTAGSKPDRCSEDTENFLSSVVNPVLMCYNKLKS